MFNWESGFSRPDSLNKTQSKPLPLKELTLPCDKDAAIVAGGFHHRHVSVRLE